MSLRGEVVRFALVGASATAVHYFTALLLAGHASIYLANLAGYLAAVGVSYFGHLHFTFRRKGAGGGHGARLVRFAVVSVLGMLSSQAALGLSHSAAGLPDAVAIAIAVVVVPGFSFIAQRLWVFRAPAVRGGR